MSILGLEPEQRFVDELVTMRSTPVRADAAEAHEGRAAEREAEEVDVVVVGGGPAGLTAGMYAARGGLSAVVLEKGMAGGQVAVTPQVENYPGFATVPGARLMEMVADQTRRYVPVVEGAGVAEVKIGRRIEVLAGGATYLCRALILATGATWRKLGIRARTAISDAGSAPARPATATCTRTRPWPWSAAATTALTRPCIWPDSGPR